MVWLSDVSGVERASEASYTGHSPGSPDVSGALDVVCVKSSEKSWEKNVYESWVVVGVVGSVDVVDISRSASDSLGVHVEMTEKVVVSRKNDVTCVVAVESEVSVALSEKVGGATWSDTMSVGETEHHNGSAP